MTGNFDKTLAKYRPSTTAVTVSELFQKFQCHKEKTLYKQSLAKYKALHKPLQDFFKNKAASKVDDPNTEGFRDYLSKGLAPVTVKERLTTINACWGWGVERKLILSNPWSDYSDFVEFLLSTGCRTGEAIGLQWQNLSDDFSTVWIEESIARGGT